MHQPLFSIDSLTHIVYTQYSVIDNKKKEESNAGKPYQISIRPGHPIIMTEVEDSNAHFSPEQIQFGVAVGHTLRAYIDSATELLEGNLSNIKEIVPKHLVNSVNIIAICCTDGIIIRYEPGTEFGKPTIGIGYSIESLRDMAPKISENVVFYLSENDTEVSIDSPGLTISLAATSGETGIQNEIVNLQHYFTNKSYHAHSSE